MSKQSRKKDALSSRIKQLFIEHLWIIALFFPLLIVGLFVNEHFQPAPKRSNMVVKSTSSVTASTAMQISSVELAEIIAKPLSELLLVEIYFDDHKRGRSRVASQTVEKGATFNNKVVVAYQEHGATATYITGLPR